MYALYRSRLAARHSLVRSLGVMEAGFAACNNLGTLRISAGSSCIMEAGLGGSDPGLGPATGGSAPLLGRNGHAKDSAASG